MEPTAIEHWTTAYLAGANASFQRAAREYAEEYAAMAVAAERERCKALGALALEYAKDDDWQRADAVLGLIFSFGRLRGNPNNKPDTSEPVT